MKLFGILLIFFNLIAGGAFLYLATQDWKGRQTINGMGVRHVLILQGLPVEPSPVPEDFDSEQEVPFVLEMGASQSTKTISKKLLASYFSAQTQNGNAAPVVGAPTDPPPPPASKVPLSVNTPVTSQLDEVKRV